MILVDFIKKYNCNPMDLRETPGTTRIFSVNGINFKEIEWEGSIKKEKIIFTAIYKQDYDEDFSYIEIVDNIKFKNNHNF